MNIHQKLLELRIRNALSQQQLAKRFGVAQTSVLAWEKSSKPRAWTLKCLAQFYHVSVDVLVLDSKPLPESSDVLDRSDASDGSGTLATLALAAHAAKLKAIAADLELLIAQLEGRK